MVTGSLGIAVYDGEEESQHDLLKEAEMAMFRAKRGGADRIEIFSPEMRGDRVDRAALAERSQEGAGEGQIKVLYQPIVSLATEELAGFEALMRWEHPRAGMMNPAAFVPVAEESDLIGKLGAHVLMRAAQDAARWHKELPAPRHRCSSASTSRAVSSSARISSRRSGTSSGAPSCRRARCVSR